MKNSAKNPTNPKIYLEHLIKIYGENSRAALALFREGKTRNSILQTTGHILGVADVSLAIHPGELFVVMGLSGSGKSTLVRCINRLIEPTSGHIYIDDEDIAHVNQKRLREIRLTKVTMVFQKFGLFPHKTVVENVEYGLKIRGMTTASRRQKALEALDIVSLSQWADYLPSALSGGMQQRVGLARALATDAEILLMDEAFSALDPLTRREMQDELLRLHQELHKTIVFISHDIQEALKLGDRIAVMNEGAIVQIGTPEELVIQPTNEYIRAFLQDINRAQVLKTGTIARQTPCFILTQDSVKVALEQMLHHNLNQMYVINNYGKPIGCVNQQMLQSAMQTNSEDITSIMDNHFPCVPASTCLESIFQLFQPGLPIAVVDAQGRFQGVIEPADILANLI